MGYILSYTANNNNDNFCIDIYMFHKPRTFCTHSLSYANVPNQIKATKFVCMRVHCVCICVCVFCTCMHMRHWDFAKKHYNVGNNIIHLKSN